MRRTLLVVAAIVLAIAATAPTASAGIVAIGDPVRTNSWNQYFVENGVGPFNRMEFFLLSAPYDLEAPGFSGFSASGWAASLVNPHYTVATGASLSQLYFYLNFTGSPGPMSAVFIAWNGANVAEKVRVGYNGGWSYTQWTGDPGDLDPLRSAPDGGATLTLLGCALVGIGALRRKFGA